MSIQELLGIMNEIRLTLHFMGYGDSNWRAFLYRCGSKGELPTRCLFSVYNTELHRDPFVCVCVCVSSTIVPSLSQQVVTG
jgi:hypothetical protein